MKIAFLKRCDVLFAGALALAGAPALAQPSSSSPAGELAWVLAEPRRCSKFDAATPTGPLRLESVLRVVVCNHVGVRSGEGLSAQALAALDLAHAAAWPTVSASAGTDTLRGQSTRRDSSLSLQWVLFDFGRRSAESTLAGHALSAVLDEQRFEVLNAVDQAATLYAAVQSAFGRLDAVTLNRHTAEDSVLMARTRHGAGAGTMGDLLQAQTALAQAKLDESRAMSQWLVARAALATAMRLPANAKLVLAAEEETDDEAPIDIEALMTEVRERHPRVSAARARLAQAEARVNAVKTETWGAVSMGAQRGTTRPYAGSATETSSSVQVKWSLPLWDGGALRARQDDAHGAVQTSRVALDESASQVELRVWQQAQSLLSERQARRNSQAVWESAQGALNVASERFRLGVGQFSDLLLAQKDAASARLQLVESQANLRREKWRLAVAAGRFGRPGE